MRFVDQIYQWLYTSFQAVVSRGNIVIGGKGGILSSCICSVVVGRPPCCENVGVNCKLGGQQVKLKGIPESLKFLSLLTVRTGLLFSFLNFALLFLNQICRKKLKNI